MEKKLRIAVDLRSLMEPFESGVTVYTKAILNRLLKNHPEIEWQLFYQGRKRIPAIHQLYPQVRHIQKSNTLFHLKCIITTPKLPLDFFSEQPDLLWMPDRRPFYKASFPIVMTVHDLIPEHQAGNFSIKGRIWHKLFSLKKLLRGVSGILTPSLTVSQSIRTKLPKEVTYEGADLAPQMTEPKSFPKKWLKEGFFLMIAPADPRKHLDWVFSAVERFPRLNFVIAGWKENDKRFKRQKKKNTRNCFFLNHISEEEKKWLLKNTRALLALSSEEGFDLPVLEAVTAKCPVLLSEIPVHHELYKEAEWVKNKEDLLRILYMSNQTALKIPTPRGIYTWDKASERILLFFLRVLRNKNR